MPPKIENFLTRRFHIARETAREHAQSMNDSSEHTNVGNQHFGPLFHGPATSKDTIASSWPEATDAALQSTNTEASESKRLDPNLSDTDFAEQIKCPPPPRSTYVDPVKNFFGMLELDLDPLELPAPAPAPKNDTLTSGDDTLTSGGDTSTSGDDTLTSGGDTSTSGDDTLTLEDLSAAIGPPYSPAHPCSVTVAADNDTPTGLQRAFSFSQSTGFRNRIERVVLDSRAPETTLLDEEELGPLQERLLRAPIMFKPPRALVELLDPNEDNKLLRPNA